MVQFFFGPPCMNSMTGWWLVSSAYWALLLYCCVAAATAIYTETYCEMLKVIIHWLTDRL